MSMVKKIKIKHAIIGLIASIILIFISTYYLYSAFYPRKYSEYVQMYAKEYSVDSNLVYSVIRSESRFNKDAVSDIGACGLMQITEETFNWAKMKINDNDEAEYKDIFIPKTNIKYGTFILSMLLDEFKNEKTAIAAYHAGWGTVKGWLSNKYNSDDGLEIDNIPFNNTSAYVVQVLSTKKIYQKLY